MLKHIWMLKVPFLVGICSSAVLDGRIFYSQTLHM